MSDLSENNFIELRGDQVSNIRFEVHIDPKTRKITTSEFACGRDRARVQEVGAHLIRSLCTRYGFLPGNLVILSDEQADNIWVWVKSRTPIPPPRLTSSENNHHRLQDHSILPDGGRRDQIIDI